MWILPQYFYTSTIMLDVKNWGGQDEHWTRFRYSSCCPSSKSINFIWRIDHKICLNLITFLWELSGVWHSAWHVTNIVTAHKLWSDTRAPAQTGGRASDAGTETSSAEIRRGGDPSWWAEMGDGNPTVGGQAPETQHMWYSNRDVLKLEETQDEVFYAPSVLWMKCA